MNSFDDYISCDHCNGKRKKNCENCGNVGFVKKYVPTERLNMFEDYAPSPEVKKYNVTDKKG